jgi:hypothetical protein
MINIHYRGSSEVCSGFANHLGQYIVGRIISKKTGYFLNSHKPGNFEDIIEENNSLMTTDNILLVDKTIVDYEKVCQHKGGIYLSGFFQDYENFRPYKEYIKKVYSFPKNNDLYNDELIAVHVRLGEYLRDDFHLPMEYYIDVVKESKKVPILYTDSPNAEYIKELSTVLNCQVRSNSEWLDFVEIASYKTIAMSQSSYSWWSAWLSDAQTVYYPYTSKRYWQHRNDGDDINFVVTDENRFILV